MNDTNSPRDDAPRKIHVACVMDGNGRWARKRGLPRTEGHTAGEQALAEVVRAAAARDVGWLTVFGFSTENWVRPRPEVRHILSLHRKIFGRVDEMRSNNASIRWIGRPFRDKGARTPMYVQRAIERAIADTAANSGLVVTVAFDYGGRAELTRAAARAAVDGPVDASSIEGHLYDPTLPPVDVLVRTSGETRISNFLLWQINGCKVYFTDRPWPDFDATELDRALALLDGN